MFNPLGASLFKRGGCMKPDIKVNTTLRFQFDVNGRDYATILNCLKRGGGNEQAIAAHLEKHRLDSWKEIITRFTTFIQTKEEDI